MTRRPPSTPIHFGATQPSKYVPLTRQYNEHPTKLKERPTTNSLSEKAPANRRNKTKLSDNKTVIEIAILLANLEQGRGFKHLIDRFEETHPNIKVHTRVYNDKEYKRKLNEWVSKADGPDVFYWQAGERLFELARRNAIQSLNPLWESHNWDRLFPENIKNLVHYKDNVYALPFAYYQWGFYYKKSVFKRLNLSPPNTWKDFLRVSQTLSENHITPLSIGTKNDWPAAAWFDYLNLRTNGLTFYRSLLAGEMPFTHSKVRDALNQWKPFIDNGYFNKGQEQLTWSEAMPLLYREIAGMTLIGNFVEKSIPTHLIEDIGFFPFPTINQQIPAYELMPTEVFAFSRWSRKTDEAYALLNYLSEPETQLSLASELGYIPATTKAHDHISPLSLEGVKLLDKSADIMQYFDRDTDQKFSKSVLPYLSGFLLEPDVDSTLNALESKRLELLIAPP
ncbi:ABC transporter substrate-binding protein [Hahella ganghwensis]|uniref:ABC transporter substrate-binding protein n=1 Tax=Hahella ganghwensis TaxID=286420 RepID=UPI00036C9654|nr:extracellular solute-binding protein [Hahella ganghwensis]